MNTETPEAGGIPALITINGLVIDADTGEVVGVEDKPAFAVTDKASAEWVLERMQLAQAELSAVDGSPAVLAARAVIANADAMKKRAQARIDGLNRRFEAELAEFARGQLEGQKARTWYSPFGSIGFRTVKGGLRVKDEDFALKVARAWGWNNCIKTTQKFLVGEFKNLDAEVQDKVKGVLGDGPRRSILDNGNPDLSRAFELVEDREAVTIKTGVPE